MHCDECATTMLLCLYLASQGIEPKSCCVLLVASLLMPPLDDPEFIHIGFTRIHYEYCKS